PAPAEIATLPLHDALPIFAVAGELAQLEALRRMVRGAAHAWNNALTTIVGELGCLADERPGDAAVAAAAAAIESEAQRCARLTPDRKSTRLNSSHVKISYA